MATVKQSVLAAIEAERDRLASLKRSRAIVEGSRIALCVAVPRMAAGLDAAEHQREAMVTAGRRVTAEFVRWREVVICVGVLLAISAVAFIFPSPRNGRPAFDVGEGALWVGLFAIAAVALLASQESYRPRSYFLGVQTRGDARRVYLFFAVLWLVAAVYMLVFWSDVPSGAVLPYVGLVLLIAAIVGMTVLWWRARSSDRTTAPAETATAVDPVDEWWQGVALRLSSREQSQAENSYTAALEALEAVGITRPADTRRLKRRNPALVWAGDSG